MAKHNMQETTNNILKFSDIKIKRVNFHKSSENDVDNKKNNCILCICI